MRYSKETVEKMAIDLGFYIKPYDRREGIVIIKNNKERKYRSYNSLYSYLYSLKRRGRVTNEH